jgi:Cu(I)/Ag(I) efflux system membrane fusion protein
MPGKNPLRAALLSAAALISLLTACGDRKTVEVIPTPSESLADAMDDSIIEHARKHADKSYICPMHPQIVQDQPGSCPICGMDLVEQEVSTDDADQDFGPPIVTIRPETVQNMGVRTAEAERGSLRKHIRTVGYVAYDEDRVAHLHPRASGWVEKLEVRAEGEEVRRGQVLYHIYSPEIVAAQEEYLITLQGLRSSRTSSGRDLDASGRKRLRLLEVPQGVVDRIARTRQVAETVPVLAPATGVVTRLGLREGMFVKPEMELFTISDVSYVWVMVDVFEPHLEWIEEGLPSEIRVAAAPERSWRGEVNYVYPELDPETRTLKVRLRFPNPDGLLKPNMLAQVMIQGSPKLDVVSVPRDALIVSGGEERVVLDLGDGRFQPRQVVSGMTAEDRIEILEGLEPGERVVVSGQFLIDSESNLQASFRRMQAPEPDSDSESGMAPAMAHQH